jgi:hypothetical protein
MLQEIADRRGGKLKAFSLFAYPELQLEVDGIVVHMWSDPGDGDNDPEAHVSFKLNEKSEWDLLVYQDTLYAKPGSVGGLRDIEIGNAEFDSVFNVKSNIEALCRQLLSSEVQKLLIDLKAMKLNMRWRSGKLDLGTRRIPRSIEQYDALLDAALSVLKQLRSINAITPRDTQQV